MKYKDKKLAVLELLRLHSEPISAAKLLEKLGPDFHKRTVRRWLGEFVADGAVVKSGKKRSTHYKAAEREISDALVYLRKPLFERKPVSYNATWLSDYRPNETSWFSESLKKELYEAGKKAEDEEPAGTYARHIFNRLLIDLSYNSSRLEGNTYSLLDTQKLILEGQGAEDKLDEEKVMILNHKEAITYLVEKANRIEVNRHTICTLHYLLSDGLVLTKYAGKIRDHSVRIGGSTYLPYVHPQQIETALTEVCEKGALIENPFEQSIFLLAHLSYLQAFTDVNKRTARLLANIPFIKNNYVPLSFNDIDRDDYMTAMLAIYELNDAQPLSELFAHSYLRTCQLYAATVDALGFDQVRVRYRQERRKILREVILNQLAGKALDDFIHTEAKKIIPQDDLEAFFEDMREDLDEISPERLAGLGVTIEQLNEWLKIISS